jgi:hypothetical protein
MTMTTTKLSKAAARILLEQVNAMLAAPGGSREGRIALSVLLEKNLHEARIYAGFRYLEVNHTGLKLWHEFLDRSREDGLYDEAYNEAYKIRYQEAFGDDSRRSYYL